MVQKITPQLEAKYGWNLGESGWNDGMDENILKFSFLFDRNIDGIIDTLPANPSNGSAYFLTTDSRLYFRVSSNWLSSPTPRWFVLVIRTTGVLYQFDGSTLVSIESSSDLSDRIEDVELTLSTLGGAAFQNVEYFATQASLDIVEASLSSDIETVSEGIIATEERFEQELFAAGYEFLGNYTAGLNVATRKQYFRRDGRFYAAKEGVTLPYSTTGDWTGESAEFKRLGDDVLRQELADPAQGAAKVAYEGRTVLAKLQDDWSVVDEGADKTGALGATTAFTAARTKAESRNLRYLSVPPGEFLLDEAVTGALPAIAGSGVGATTIKTGASNWAFDFTNNSPSLLFSKIADLNISGNERYIGGKGVRIPQGYNTILSNLTMNNLEAGIELGMSWVSAITHMKATHVTNPLYLDIGNSSLVSHFYAQRFKGAGINQRDSLAPIMQAITLEYGMDNATGVLLQGTHSARLTGLYTEGDMGTDISLSQKNQGLCLNTTLESLWLNSYASERIINATYATGLSVNDVTLQTPQAPHVIQVPSRSDEMVYVSNVLQVDTNANDYIGDVRGEGQPLIPIGNDNRQIFITKPSAKHGDGSQSDLTNIQNNTARDARNVCPRLYKAPTIAAGTLPSSLSCASSSSTFGYSAGFWLASDFHGSCKVLFSGAVTNSSGSQPFFEMRLRNETTGEDGEIALSASAPAAGGAFEYVRHVNVRPGLNLIKLGITKTQGGGGTNTFTCEVLAVL